MFGVPWGQQATGSRRTLQEASWNIDARGPDSEFAWRIAAGKRQVLGEAARDDVKVRADPIGHQELPRSTRTTRVERFQVRLQ